MIEYHNPEGQVAVEIEPYTLSANISGSEAISIGFLANGFPDSENFLNELQKAMQKLAPNIDVHGYNKGNASMPASQEMISKIQGECQAVVAAYGHWGSCTTGTVRDGVNFARIGMPAVALVTDEFWPQGDFVAQSLGMPDVPRVQLPHPIAGTGTQNMEAIAADYAALIIKALEADNE